jgi:hypothetical protein
MEQKIVTGGTSNTSTPILKFLMNEALFEEFRTALHIEHCASAELANTNTMAIATIKTAVLLSCNEGFIMAPRERVQRVPAL